jgi:hypothetical protein
VAAAWQSWFIDRDEIARAQNGWRTDEAGSGLSSGLFVVSSGFFPYFVRFSSAPVSGNDL